LGIDFLVKQPWAGVAIWVALYVSDYALTIRGAKLRLKCEQHIRFEAYELTPYYRKDIAELRVISPRFIYQLLLSSVAIVMLWWLCTLEMQIPEIYEGALGALILVELAVHLRHLHNLYTFHYISRSEGVSGCIQYSMWMTLRISGWELLGYTGLWLVLAVLTGRWFFVGGAIKCLATAIQHWKLSDKDRNKPAESHAESATREELGPTPGE
jgi:hypothetical protein